jgi:hypothetical protein
MKREVAQPVGLLLVAVAAFVIVVPFVNIGLGTLPWRPAVRDWRFGAWGFVLGALTLPVVGLGLLGVGGVLRDSRAVLWTGLIVSLVLAGATIVGLADFLTAGTAMKQLVTEPKALALYDQEIRRTTLISALAIPALLALVLAHYRMLKAAKVDGAAGPESILHVTKS